MGVTLAVALSLAPPRPTWYPADYAEGSVWVLPEQETDLPALAVRHFPPAPLVGPLWRQAYDLQLVIERRMRDCADAPTYRRLEALHAAAEYRQDVLNELDNCRRKNFDPAFRRRALERLLRLLGDDDFHAGRLPPPVLLP